MSVRMGRATTRKGTVGEEATTDHMTGGKEQSLQQSLPFKTGTTARTVERKRPGWGRSKVGGNGVVVV